MYVDLAILVFVVCMLHSTAILERHVCMCQLITVDSVLSCCLSFIKTCRDSKPGLHMSMGFNVNFYENIEIKNLDEL